MKKIRRMDWIVILAGLLVGVGFLVYGIVKNIICLITGIGIIILAVLHLAWASKLKESK